MLIWNTGQTSVMSVILVIWWLNNCHSLSDNLNLVMFSLVFTFCDFSCNPFNFIWNFAGMLQRAKLLVQTVFANILTYDLILTWHQTHCPQLPSADSFELLASTARVELWNKITRFLKICPLVRTKIWYNSALKGVDTFCLLLRCVDFFWFFSV